MIHYKISGLQNRQWLQFRFSGFLLLAAILLFSRASVARVMQQWEGATADVYNHGAFVGRFVSPGFAGCNVSYLKYPSGHKAIVTSSHCVARNGKAGDLGLAEVEFGLELGARDNQVIRVQQIECGTLEADKAPAFLDECILKVERFPVGIDPVERVYLSVEERNEIKRKDEKIGLFAFHSSRTASSRLPDPRGGDTDYTARKTRTVQMCDVLDNPGPYPHYDTFRYVFHNCDTLRSTSGAALVRWNKEKNGWQMIGLHKGGYSKVDSEPNFAVNAFPEELLLLGP